MNKFFKIKDEPRKTSPDLACELQLLYKDKYEAVEFHWRSKLNTSCAACKAFPVFPSKKKRMA